MQNPTYALFRGIWELIDWVFPPTCGGCGQRGDVWCSACQALTPAITPPVCDCCGQPVVSANRLCAVCEVTRPNYTALRAFGIFSGPLRSAIHQLKYERNLGLGNAFAIMLRDLFIDLHWPVNYVVPVPLSKARFKQRGYNQAAVIAYPFALLAGLQYSSKILKRTKDTRSQVGLSQRDRQVNVHDAFEAKTRNCYNLSFLVIDDVATTGSTLNACAAALLQAGANQIYCLTIARTDHPQFAVGLQEEQLKLQSIT